MKFRKDPQARAIFAQNAREVYAADNRAWEILRDGGVPEKYFSTIPKVVALKHGDYADVLQNVAGLVMAREIAEIYAPLTATKFRDNLLAVMPVMLGSIGFVLGAFLSQGSGLPAYVTNAELIFSGVLLVDGGGYYGIKEMLNAYRRHAWDLALKDYVGRVKADQAQMMQGGIDLGQGGYLNILATDAAGMPHFDPAQVQKLQKDLRGIIPVPVGVPHPVSVGPLLGV